VQDHHLELPTQQFWYIRLGANLQVSRNIDYGCNGDEAISIHAQCGSILGYMQAKSPSESPLNGFQANWKAPLHDEI